MNGDFSYESVANKARPINAFDSQDIELRVAALFSLEICASAYRSRWAETKNAGYTLGKLIRDANILPAVDSINLWLVLYRVELSRLT